MPRHFAIGDIHGCFDALRLLGDYVPFRDDDVIVTLGDYCDRGPNTNAVLDWLIHFGKSHRLIPLRGNHEILMINARESEADHALWMAAGGEATLRSYTPFDDDSGSLVDIPEHHWSFLTARLQPFFECETHFFVHANAYAELPLVEQPDFMLYWEHLLDPPRHCSGKVMVCGHTPQKSGLPLATGNVICLDTWAYGGGWLSCLHVESGKVWQANEIGETREILLDELPRSR